MGICASAQPQYESELEEEDNMAVDMGLPTSQPPAKPRDEGHMISGFEQEAKKNIRPGDKFYMIDSKWWSEWAKFVHYGHSKHMFSIVDASPKAVDTRKKPKDTSGTSGEELTAAEDGASSADEVSRNVKGALTRTTSSKFVRPGKINNIGLLIGDFDESDGDDVDFPTSKRSRKKKNSRRSSKYGSNYMSHSRFPRFAHEVRDDLIENENFVLVCHASFQKLRSWYGGGPKITRYAVKTIISDSTVVEVYPLRLKVYRVNEKNISSLVEMKGGKRFSISATVDGHEMDGGDARLGSLNGTWRIVRKRQKESLGGDGSIITLETFRKPEGMSDDSSNEDAKSDNDDFSRAPIKRSNTEKSHVNLLSGVDPDNVVASRALTVQQLLQQIGEQSSVDVSTARLWDFNDTEKFQILDSLDKVLEDVPLVDGQTLLLEELGKNNKWPMDPYLKEMGMLPPTDSSMDSDAMSVRSGGSGRVTRGPSIAPSADNLVRAVTYPGHDDFLMTLRQYVGTSSGTTGMKNLGNTCFMNSAVQCLRHTAPLLMYVLSGEYRNDINKKNPIGTQGRLINEFAKISKLLWSGSRSVTPKNFRWTIGKHAPRFSGYLQQDAQELLAYLLDGMHEDVNRVLEKKYVEEKDLDPKLPHHILSREAWNTYLKRNDSVIVDWFQGQYKSTLVCPDCSSQSIRFDPFMYLSLPLPRDQYRFIDVIFVPHQGDKPITLYTLKVPRKGNILHLKQQLSEMAGTLPRNLVVADVYQHRVYKYYVNKNPLRTIGRDDEIFAFEIVRFPDADEEKKENGDADNSSSSPQKKKKKANHAYITVFSYREGGRGPIGIPLLLSLPSPKAKYEDMYVALLELMQRMLHTRKSKKPIPKEFAHFSKKVQHILASRNHPFFEIRRVEDGHLVPLTVVPGGGDANGDGGSNEMNGHRSNAKGDAHDRAGGSRRRQKKGNSVRSKSGSRRGAPTQMEEDVPPVPLSSLLNLTRGEDLIDLSDGRPIAIEWYDEAFRNFYDSQKEGEIEINEATNEQSTELKLDQCLEQFTSSEVLGKDDMWRCSNCKDFKRAEKRIDLWKLPPVLVIHLKRFSYGRYDVREKLETMVDFPLKDLDLSKHLGQAIKAKQEVGDGDSKRIKIPHYNLYAVSNHYGRSGAGHYTAFARNNIDGRWYEYDDDHVTPVGANQVKSKAAYVLFYIRQDLIAI